MQLVRLALVCPDVALAQLALDLPRRTKSQPSPAEALCAPPTYTLVTVNHWSPEEVQAHIEAAEAQRIRILQEAWRLDLQP